MGVDVEEIGVIADLEVVKLCCKNKMMFEYYLRTFLAGTRICQKVCIFGPDPLLEPQVTTMRISEI